MSPTLLKPSAKGRKMKRLSIIATELVLFVAIAANAENQGNTTIQSFNKAKKILLR
jgi:hypothetical protein